MSVSLICSDHQMYGDQALQYVRGYYPDVSAIYLARRRDDPSKDAQDGTLRVRSRGRHNPGSGSYFCSHITPKGKISGYKVGSVLYATNLPWVGYEEGPRAAHVSYAYGSWTADSYYQYWNGQTVYYYYSVTHQSESNGRITWHVLTYMSNTKWSTYEHARNVAFSHEPSVETWTWNRGVSISETSILPPPTFEDRHVKDQIDAGTLPQLDFYLNDAYLKAFNSLPIIKTNNIQNLFAIYEFLKGIVDPIRSGGRLIDSIGSVDDAWLGYRYIYNTTKSDIQELVSVVDRCRTLGRTNTFRAYGVSHTEGRNGTYTFKCSLTTRLDDVFGCYSEIERLGLALDGYNAWDLIPYSFMVDWFLHIGDLIESGRDWSHAMKLSPSISDSWFSMTHSFVNSTGGSQVDYYRWPCVGVSAMLPASMLTHQQSRGSTWVKRGADAFAIFH